jgi:hypothetical protein
LRDGEGRSVQGMAAVIPRDVRHATGRSTGPILAVYMSPEHASGRRLALLGADSHAQSWLDAALPLCSLSGDLAKSLPSELESQGGEEVLADLTGARVPRAEDPSLPVDITPEPRHADFLFFMS